MVAEGTEIELEGRSWRIDQRLGSGSFGEVYAAEGSDGERAALKFLTKVAGANRETLMAPATHGKSNVLPIWGVGEYGDGWVLAMPLGETDLRKHLDGMGSGLSVEDALKILVDIARALAEIEEEVVHRDLKPENIVLWRNSWHVTDFGIARYADAATATETWKDAKSYAYAAPEQWKDERAESRTDVYAFGVIAYELLAGRKPFPGPSSADFKSQHLTNQPSSLSEFNLDLKLTNLVEWCLGKTPSSRPSASMVLQQLSQVHSGNVDTGLQSLRRAQQSIVQQRTIREAEAEAKRIRQETRAQLFEDARASLKKVVAILWQTLNDEAPALVDLLAIDELFEFNLNLVHNEAVQVVISCVDPVEEQDWESHSPCFDVIAKSGISMGLMGLMRRDENRPQRWAGRYTWWYCDAQEEDVFRWYEVSFRQMRSTVPGGNWVEPIRPELPEAGAAIVEGEGLDSPFVAIDQADVDKFANRWGEWIGDAFAGRLPETGGYTMHEILSSHRR